MPRRPDLDRPVELSLMLPETIRTKLDLHLYSELEGRVPKGKYREFFLERLQEFFSWRRIDLAPYGFPEGFFVAGPREMLDELEKELRRQ